MSLPHHINGYRTFHLDRTTLSNMMLNALHPKCRRINCSLVVLNVRLWLWTCPHSGNGGKIKQQSASITMTGSIIHRKSTHVNSVCSKKFSFNSIELKTPRSWGLELIYQILPSWGQTIIWGLACEIGRFSAARSNTKGFSFKIYGSRKGREGQVLTLS